MDASEAVIMVEQLHPNLIILDLLFNTGMEGWQLLYHLRAAPAIASIPVLLCTTVVHLEYQQENYGREQGITMLQKPFDIDMLLHLVRQLLASYPVSFFRREMHETCTYICSKTSSKQRCEWKAL